MTAAAFMSSGDDKEQIAKLEKKLAKLRKQLKSQQPADTAASTESEDSAVAVPEESQGKSKKAKKRSREAAGEFWNDGEAQF